MHELLNHLRQAIRQLRRSAGFSLTAVLTLGIGIGATTAIFSIFYAVLLKPLPYPRADRLVDLKPLVATPGRGELTEDQLSYPNFRDWREQARSFDAMAAYHAGVVVLDPHGGSAARNLQIGIVSGDFFQTLRVVPALGRAFSRDEEKQGSKVVILSHDLWVSDFHASPAVIGSSVKLSDELYTVAGVLPEKASFPFAGATPMDLWTTSAFDAVGKNPSTEQRGWNWLDTIARLKPGVSVAQANAELNGIARGLAKQYPDDDANLTAAKVTPALEAMTGDVRPALRVLFAAVAALLLIACANVAGLLLARGESRQTELAVRAALGAGRARITLQLLLESVLLSLAGGLAGVFVAVLALNGALGLVPKNLPRLDDVAINLPVLLFAVAVSVFTGVLFGLLPAIKMSRLDPALALRDGARTSTAGRRQHRLHAALVIGETAMGLVLLIGAGLMVRSFVHLLNTDPGFNPDHLLTFRVGISGKDYPPEKRSQFADRLLARLDHLPGVQAATAAFPLPFSGGTMSINFAIEGQPVKAADEPHAQARVIEPNYFAALQGALDRGRLFTAQDNQADAPAVAVVNETFAKKFFPGQNAVGKRIATGFDDDDNGNHAHWREIVGVVADAKNMSQAEETAPTYFIPFAQAPVSVPFFAMRVAGDPLSYEHAISAAVSALDPQAPVYRVRAMQQDMARASAQPRFQALLLTAFAAVALLLAAIGLYAVLSYMVAQRTQEIGLRMALGARRGDVLAMVLRRGLHLALAGLALGMALSVGITRLLAGLLYGVEPLDPITFVSVAAVLLLVSALASLVPALRAASLDPMTTLRNS